MIDSNQSLNQQYALNVSHLPVTTKPGPPKIYRLINSIFYFIDCVFIMELVSGYRLVGIHLKNVLFDREYPGLKGAKIAFSKLNKKKAWSEDVEALWSYAYEPYSQWYEEKLKILKHAQCCQPSTPGSRVCRPGDKSKVKTNCLLKEMCCITASVHELVFKVPDREVKSKLLENFSRLEKLIDPAAAATASLNDTDEHYQALVEKLQETRSTIDHFNPHQQNIKNIFNQLHDIIENVSGLLKE
ncbi:MAG: hypothetical protein JSV88_20735 [Candidatus Aminicenantes bacterium]|nr:MAG: hypothetical protein JSV88_20735 [Candidatus Aminicenantes bacterium]